MQIEYFKFFVILYLIEDICMGCQIEKTIEFDQWFRKLDDFIAKAKILFRIQKLETDAHFGDCKPVENGIIELKIHY